MLATDAVIDAVYLVFLLFMPAVSDFSMIDGSLVKLNDRNN